MAEEFTKYQKQWDDYKDANAYGCLIVLIVVPIFGVILYFFRSFPQYSKEIGFLAFGLVCIMSLIYVLPIFPKRNCPRCHKIFKNGSNSSLNENKCSSCDLPLYYGSSYFLDFWGVEQCKQFAKEFKEEKKNFEV